MTDDYEAELAAEMRLAFTRAAVAFPRVNPTPITLAVYHVFSDVFYDLKRRHRWSIRHQMNPYDEGMLALITGLVSEAVVHLSAKKSVGEVVIGLNALDAKKTAQLVSGLDTGAARQLLAFARDPANTVEQVKQKRQNMLLTRRNMLAAKLCHQALESARQYFLSEVPDA